MSKTFNYAIINGYICKDPSEGVILPRRRSIAAQTVKSTRQQETCPKSLITAIFERFPEGHPCHIPLLLGYRCGLRLGEVYGLLIDDFDRANRTLTIRRQIQFNENNQLYFTDPKYCDPGEYRVIDLDADTCRVLTRHVQKIEACRPVLRHKQYYVSMDGIVNETGGEPIYFLNVRPEDGSYISPRTMQHVSRVIHGKESNFDNVDVKWDFHILRHTHASECIAAGMPPESVRTRLGHRHLTTTYRFYVHETEDQTARAKSILEGMFR
jgi:integrase